ncbi:MAG: hypothetical protein WCA10_17930 [Terracidiphilus sp.]
MKSAIGHGVIVWTLFFVICMSLGYPTLNRYDPRSIPGLSDSNGYYALVTGADDQAGDESHRVLVPYLAKPVYWMAKGHLNTWNPVFFALLVVNSFFISTTAFMLVSVSRRIAGNDSAALVSGLLYLSSFAVANLNLSGYVDSAVNCMMMAVVWTMLAERWWLLPLWGVLGAIAKETFVPLAAVLVFGWWLTAFRRGARRLSQLAWLGAMVTLGFVALTLLMSRGSSPYSPLSFAASRWAESGSGHFYLSGLYRCLVAREFLFTFAWLLPLGLWRLGRMPRTWVIGSASAALAALAMGAYDDALGNAARAVFSALGPLLSLSASLLLLETSTRGISRSERSER